MGEKSVKQGSGHGALHIIKKTVVFKLIMFIKVSYYCIIVLSVYNLSIVPIRDR